MIDKLIIIGERINQSNPKIKEALKTKDWEHLQNIALEQEKAGAHYLDVNVGTENSQVMAEAVIKIQESVKLPLCFDSDAPCKLHSALTAYDFSCGTPILNSATESKLEAVLINPYRVKVILLLTERYENGSITPNKSYKEKVETAQRLYAKAINLGYKPGQIYFDPGTYPLATDIENAAKSSAKDSLETISCLKSLFPDSHQVIGLSNFSVQMPKPLRLSLENVYLTMAMENGLDTIIGNPAKDYKLIAKDSLIFESISEILNTIGETNRLEKIAGLCTLNLTQ